MLSDYIFLFAEILGIIAFAVSGSIVALDRGLDLFGFIISAGVTALGGGIIRDILISSLPPKAFFDYHLLLISVLFSVGTFIFFSFVKNKISVWETRLVNLFNILDAIGLAAFSVTGVQTGIEAGYSDNVFLCVFLGMTTAVGGGILRDIIVSKVPMVLKEQIYATASILGSTLYFYLSMLDVSGELCVYISMLFIICLRLISLRFGLSLPHIGSRS